MQDCVDGLFLTNIHATREVKKKRVETEWLEYTKKYVMTSNTHEKKK